MANIAGVIAPEKSLSTSQKTREKVTHVTHTPLIGMETRGNGRNARPNDFKQDSGEDDT